jgi:hypothetical protein
VLGFGVLSKGGSMGISTIKVDKLDEYYSITNTILSKVR